MGEKKYRSKFSKRKCRKCKYGKNLSGAGTENTRMTYCDYHNEAEYHGPIVMIQGEKVDLRGSDRDNCLLYEKG